MAKRAVKRIEDLIHTSVYELVPAGAISARMAEEVRRSLAGNVVRFEEEYRNSWFDNSIFPLTDTTEKITTVAVYSHDITDVKRVEIDLQQVNNELIKEKENLLVFSSILDTMDDSASFTDYVGQIQYINQSFEKRMGYTLAEVQGKHISEFQYPGDGFAIGKGAFIDNQ